MLVSLSPYTDPLLNALVSPKCSSQVKFEFSEVKRGECVLIPGSIVVMERMEKTGSLPKYMSDHLNWIGGTFASVSAIFSTTYAGDQGFVRRICALFTSFLTIPQL